MNHTKGKKNQWHTDDVLRDTLTHEEKTLTPLPYSNVAWGPTARACTKANFWDPYQTY